MFSIIRFEHRLLQLSVWLSAPSHTQGPPHMLRQWWQMSEKFPYSGDYLFYLFLDYYTPDPPDAKYNRYRKIISLNLSTLHAPGRCSSANGRAVVGVLSCLNGFPLVPLFLSLLSSILSAAAPIVSAKKWTFVIVSWISQSPLPIVVAVDAHLQQQRGRKEMRRELGKEGGSTIALSKASRSRFLLLLRKGWLKINIRPSLINTLSLAQKAVTFRKS